MGPIDFSDRILAKRLNVRPHKAHALVEDLIQRGKLCLTSTGKITNHRAEREIVYYITKSVQNQLNATSNRGGSVLKPQKANVFNLAAKPTPSEITYNPDKENKKESFSFELGARHPLDHRSKADRANHSVEEFKRRVAQKRQ